MNELTTMSKYNVLRFILKSFPCEKVRPPRRPKFSHGKLSKIDPMDLKSY